MTFSKNRVAKRNIEKTMHESSFGVSKTNGKPAVCSIGEFDELNLVNGNNAKCSKKPKANSSVFDPTNENSKTESQGKPAKSSAEQSETKDIAASEDKAPASDSFTTSDFSKSTDSSSESEDLLSLSELRLRQRRHAAAMRNQQSGGPMILSRRMSYKLSSTHHSPAFSPITAIELVFSPGTIALTNKNKLSLDPR